MNTFRFIAFLLLMVTLDARPAGAQSSLPDLSLEELMGMDSGRVFGASLRTQPATEAPSSVSFITAEEIERFGYRSLGDILRGVRGFYVTQDRNFSYLGTRGFGKPGDYNSRVLLLINGHRVNDNVFGQAEIGQEFGLDPALFERVEIIRGPGSSLYGASAFFAVVNVITKSGVSVGPGSVAVEAGTLGTRALRASAGRRFGNGLEAALSGTLAGSAGVNRLYFPEFDSPVNNNGVAEALDGERVRQAYTQLRSRSLTFTGAYGWRKRDVPTASFGTVFNEQESPEQTTDRHTLADLEYVRPLPGNGRLTARAAYDRFTYDGTYPFAGDTPAAPISIGNNGVVGSRWSAEGRVTHVLPGRQVLTAGAEFIDNVQQNQLLQYSGDTMPVFDRHRSSRQRAVYANDEWKVARWLILNGGVRYDGYDHFTRVTPRSGLIITPSSRQAVKYLFGSAFRAPNEYELNGFYFGAGVENLRPETIATHELVWENYRNDWLRTAVSGYRYRAEHLITLVPAPSLFLGTTFINEGHVVASGLELEAQMRLPRGIQAITSYALQRAENEQTGARLANSPTHMFKARLSGVSARLHGASVSTQFVALGSRQTLVGRTLGAAATVDATVVVPLSKRYELTANAYNLFDVRYSDPVSDAHRQDAIPQDGRTIRIGVRVNFKAR